MIDNEPGKRFFARLIFLLNLISTASLRWLRRK